MVLSFKKDFLQLKLEVVTLITVLLLAEYSRQVSSQGLQATRSDLVTRVTEGSSGDRCGDGFARCLQRVRCKDGNCECRSGVGRGDFRCYGKDDLHVEILNDPNIRTISREFAHLPVPCRYLVSHFKTTFSYFFDSTCEVMVHAHNAKYRGKSYVQGVDISLRISTPFTRPPEGELSLRTYGTALNGRYVFKEYGAVEYRPDGPWNMTGDDAALTIVGSLIHLRHDPYDNTAFLRADECGFYIQLRPMDLAYGKDQRQIPGLSVSVDKNHDPKFLSHGKVLSLVPGLLTLKDITAEEGLGEDHTLAMVNRLFAGRAKQNQYNAAPTCDEIPDALENCPSKAKRNKALKACHFILAKPIFVSCFDQTENGEVILQSYKLCVEAICQRSSSKLKKLKEDLKRCSDHHPVQDFLNNIKT